MFYNSSLIIAGMFFLAPSCISCISGPFSANATPNMNFFHLGKAQIRPSHAHVLPTRFHFIPFSPFRPKPTHNSKPPFHSPTPRSSDHPFTPYYISRPCAMLCSKKSTFFVIFFLVYLVGNVKVLTFALAFGKEHGSLLRRRNERVH